MAKRDKFTVRMFTATGVMLLASCSYNTIECCGYSDCRINDRDSLERKIDYGHEIETDDLLSNDSTVSDTDSPNNLE